MNLQAGISYFGRSQFVEMVMNLLGLEVGEHTRVRMHASDVVVDRPSASKRRRRMPSDGRLKRRAAKVGLQVQPSGDDVEAPPGVRRCGICRMPGHKVQTCPAAKQQLLGPNEYAGPDSGLVAAGAAGSEGLMMNYATADTMAPVGVLGDEGTLVSSAVPGKGTKRGRMSTKGAEV